MDISSHWSSAKADVHEPTGSTHNRRLAPRPLESHEVELSSLGGYALLIGLMAGCMLLSAWSRIDLRETAVALGSAERAYTAAQAETSRLALELSTLEDPAGLSQTAAALFLNATPPVIDLTETP